MSNNNSTRSQCHKFVSHTIRVCSKNKGLAASLRRSVNPCEGSGSWEHLIACGVSLNDDEQRMAYTTIAAAIARKKPSANGTLGIGRAMALCYEDGRNNDQAKRMLNRLLGCRTTEDACQTVTRFSGLIESRVKGTLNYVNLLVDLLFFEDEDQAIRIKSRWAMDFYGTFYQDDEDENEVIEDAA